MNIWRPEGELPRLEIRHLKQLGLLRYSRYADVNVGKYALTIKSDLPGGCIEVHQSELTYYHELEIVRSPVFGEKERHYFICSVTGKRCSHLFLYRGHFVSKGACHGRNRWNSSRRQRRAQRIWDAYDQLVGAQGYRAATGMRRQRLILFLRTEPFIGAWFPDLLDIFWEEDKKRAQRLKRVLRSNLHRQSVHAAHATDYPRPLTDAEIAACLSSRLEPPSPSFEAPVPRELPIAFREDHMVLNISALARAAEPREGEARGYLVRWASGRHAKVVFDLRKSNQPQLIIYPDPLPTGWRPQVLELVRGGRWYMKCPILGTRHDLFFYREGKFASPRANRLVHRSQR